MIYLVTLKSGCKNHYNDKELISKHTKNSYNSIAKKVNNLINKGEI